ALIITGNALECIGFSEIAPQRYNFLAKQANIYRFFCTFALEIISYTNAKNQEYCSDCTRRPWENHAGR
ncbi:MAG: hypothetical protein ACFN27_05830, partial [Prevotella sp.]